MARQSKWVKTNTEFDDFELDGKFSPKTRNLLHFSHGPPERQ